jgi:hypothetical protein
MISGKKLSKPVGELDSHFKTWHPVPRSDVPGRFPISREFVKKFESEADWPGSF